MLALAAFGIPILGSFLTLAANRLSAGLRNIVAVLIGLAALLCALALIPLAGEVHWLTFGSLPIPGLELNFLVDGLGVYVAVASSLIGLLIIVYSLGYMKEYEHLGEYYFLVAMFVGAMMGLVLSANLLVLYIFWEVTAICSWRLIGFHRRSEHLRNADAALLITVFGSFLMLTGLEMIWHEEGTLTLTSLRGQSVSDLALVFLFVGMLAKSAQVPLQVWLPAAGVAPSPVTALLHAAVLVVIGVYAFARVLVGSLGLPIAWQQPVLIIASTTILVAGAAALVENDAKRILAYSTIAQLAYVLLGFAGLTGLSVAGALVFLLAHSLAKAGLFLCVGITEQATHTRDIRELGGLARRLPVTAAAFVLCALTIIGFPPTPGFFGKLMIVMGMLESGNPLFAVLAVLGALVTLMYMLRLFTAMFLGEEHRPQSREGTPIMLAVVSAFAGLSLAVGLGIGPLLNLVNGITAQLLR